MSNANEHGHGPTNRAVRRKKSRKAGHDRGIEGLHRVIGQQKITVVLCPAPGCVDLVCAFIGPKAASHIAARCLRRIATAIKDVSNSERPMLLSLDPKPSTRISVVRLRNSLPPVPATRIWSGEK